MLEIHKFLEGVYFVNLSIHEIHTETFQKPVKSQVVLCSLENMVWKSNFSMRNFISVNYECMSSYRRHENKTLEK